jgi:hypothetical protein
MRTLRPLPTLPILPILLLAFLASIQISFAARTTVTGTVVKPDGSYGAGCKIFIAAQSTWVNNQDGTVTLAGQTSGTTTNSIGAFSIAVYPNDDTNPSSTSYLVTFSCKAPSQVWSVPTGGPVTMGSVMVASTPPTVVPFVSSIFAQSGAITTLTAGNGHTLTYSGTGIVNANRILGTTLTSLTGVVKMASGIPSVVSGSASDCVKVDGTSGACGTGTPAGSSGQLQYNNAGALGAVNLWRESADLIRQRNSTTAQQFDICNTYTDSSNYECAQIRWAANVLLMGSGKLGTGVARITGLYSESDTRLYSGTSHRWTVTSADGHLVAATDNAHDIGSASANRPRNIYLAAPAAGALKITATGLVTNVSGTASDCVKVDGSSGACGTGSPGGSSGQLQYNNAGAFGGLGFGNGIQNSGGNVQVDTAIVATLNAANTFTNAVDVTGATFSRKLSIDTVGSDIASATTIAPDSPIHKVTGTTTTTTITVPASCAATNKGCTITFIPTGAWPLNTGGNIAKAVTATANVPIVLTYSHALTAWYPLTDTGGTTTPTTIVSVPATCRADGTCDSIWGSWSTSGTSADALNNTTQNIPSMKFTPGSPADAYALIPFTVPNNYTSGNVSVRINYVTAFGGSDVWKFSTLCPTGDEALARSWTAEQTVNETSSTPTTTFWGGDFSLAALTLDSTCTAGVSGYIRLHRTDSATGNRWVLSALITFP